MNHKWCLKNCTGPCDSYKDCLAVTSKSEKNIKHRFCFQVEFSYLEKLLVCVHCSESELHLHKRALYITCLWKKWAILMNNKNWEYIVFVLPVISLIFKWHIWQNKSLPNLLFCTSLLRKDWTFMRFVWRYNSQWFTLIRKTLAFF